MVHETWGHKDYSIFFNKDINIIIGKNASGKTTLINLLHYAISGNFFALSRMKFKHLTLIFENFSDATHKYLDVGQNNGEMYVSWDGMNVSIECGDSFGLEETDESHEEYIVSRRVNYEFSHIRQSLSELVPAVWLPVSRRLPIVNEEDAERRRLHRKPLESVDECLSGLLENLKRYRISLDYELSELRKEFQKHALETILYDKKHDRLDSYKNDNKLSNEDQDRLLKAFVDIGFGDQQIKDRIKDHFAAAARAAQNMQR